ncbi:hypothetical protein ABI_30070 [Asticcacaulis biprosthecium C19]|uniref:Uncharacterized protein n=1 Tax=Asticcacaulis biprosthecium C19 TaxID=715226 RepID=F4QN00_9CAUL|nr:hypothetical protein ABI_30070 [Asticcacaulis biprosthecium C19]
MFHTRPRCAAKIFPPKRNMQNDRVRTCQTPSSPLRREEKSNPSGLAATPSYRRSPCGGH